MTGKQGVPIHRGSIITRQWRRSYLYVISIFVYININNARKCCINL